MIFFFKLTSVFMYRSEGVPHEWVLTIFTVILLIYKTQSFLWVWSFPRFWVIWGFRGSTLCAYMPTSVKREMWSESMGRENLCWKMKLQP